VEVRKENWVILNQKCARAGRAHQGRGGRGNKTYWKQKDLPSPPFPSSKIHEPFREAAFLVCFRAFLKAYLFNG